MQCKYYQILLERTCEWSLWKDGHFIEVVFKVYLRTTEQNYFLPESSPWCVINFFYVKEKCFVLEISRFLRFCEIHKFQNLWCHHRHCCIMEVKILLYFFWILSTVKMKFGQILVYLITNISNMFLAQCWIRETSSRLFYDFVEMTI